MKNASLAILLLIPIIGICCDGERRNAEKPKKYKNIERVFMHTPGTYSFMVRKEDEEIEVVGGGGEYKLFTDVPPGMPMWAEETWGGEWDRKFEIHIHNVSEVNGGSYRLGKSGTANTIPLEQ